MRISATIGNESHSTSSGWSKISINGARVSHRDAISKEWLSKFGDRHASWCECIFEIPDGAEVIWEAGANSGSRGSDRSRQNFIFRVDSRAEVTETESLGYPASAAKLRGRLILVSDRDAQGASAHQALRASL